MALAAGLADAPNFEMSAPQGRARTSAASAAGATREPNRVATRDDCRDGAEPSRVAVMAFQTTRFFLNTVARPVSIVEEKPDEFRPSETKVRC